MPTDLASLGSPLAFVCGVLCLLLDLRTTYEANRCCIACFSKILHYAQRRVAPLFGIERTFVPCRIGRGLALILHSIYILAYITLRGLEPSLMSDFTTTSIRYAGVPIS